LSVWQEAIQFADLVYELTGDFPGEGAFRIDESDAARGRFYLIQYRGGSSGASRTDFARFV